MNVWFWCSQVNPNFRVVTFSDQRLQCCNLSSLAPLSSALKQIDRESRRPPPEHLGSIDEAEAGSAEPSLDASLGAASDRATRSGSVASTVREDVHYELSSASHVLINPTQPTDMGALKLKRSSFSTGQR